MDAPICKFCGTCCECAEEARVSRMPKDNEIYQSMGWPQAPRASRMPKGMASVDPTFLDGVREYAPDDFAIKEKE